MDTKHIHLVLSPDKTHDFSSLECMCEPRIERLLDSKGNETVIIYHD